MRKKGISYKNVTILILLICNCALANRIIHVDNNGPGDFNNIQAAIDDANDGDTILVADGTYTGDGNRDIDFKGKAITLKSQNGPKTCIIYCQGKYYWLIGEKTSTLVDEPHRGFLFSNNENASSIIDGFTVTNGFEHSGGAGIACSGSNPFIRNCIFRENRSWVWGAGVELYNSNAIFENCIISGNFQHGENSIYGSGGGIYAGPGYPVFRNCTVFGNKGEIGGGVVCGSGLGLTVLENCIITNNSRLQIYAGDGTIHGGSVRVEIRHCCIGNEPNAIFVGYWPNPSEPMEGSIIRENPLFVSLGYWYPNETPDNQFDDYWVEGDYHLKSQAGRFDPNTQTWVQDDITSPCIDAGDPNSPIGLEPFPNGGYINMGAYGGTSEASKSYFGEPVCEIIVTGDINGDCKVDQTDLDILMLHWLKEY